MLLNERSVARLLGVKPAELWRHITKPGFPPAVAYQHGGLLWREEDIKSYLKSSRYGCAS